MLGLARPVITLVYAMSLRHGMQRESNPDAEAGAWSRCVLACEPAPADFL
jgi:hypothetical protein